MSNVKNFLKRQKFQKMQQLSNSPRRRNETIIAYLLTVLKVEMESVDKTVMETWNVKGPTLLVILQN